MQVIYLKINIVKFNKLFIIYMDEKKTLTKYTTIQLLQFEMSTDFINLKISKTFDPQTLLLELENKTNLEICCIVKC